MRILILALLCPIVLAGQGKVDAKTFFSIGMAGVDAQVREEQKKVAFSWIEEYEVRTETRDLDPDQQEYTLRLSPSSPGRRKALKGAYEHLRNKPDFESEEARCDRRMEVHLDWLTLFLLNQQLRSLSEYEVIMQDKQAVMEKLVGTYEFDVKKLIRLEMDKNDLAVDIYNMKRQAEIVSDRYGLSFATLDFEGFVGVEKIENDIRTPLDSQLIADAKFLYKREQIQREIAVERSDNRQFLDFLQVRYQGPHTDLLKERVSIGLGFSIPNSGDRKLKIQELKYEQQELAREASLNEEEQSLRLSALQKKLESDLEALYFQRTISEQEAKRLGSISSLIIEKEGFDPLLLLDIEERQVQRRLVLLQKLENIYVGYLKYLDASQQMCNSDKIFFLE